MRFTKPFVFPLLVLSVLCGNPSAQAQGPYTLRTVLLNGTPIPGSADNFAFNFEAGFSIDENFISFTQRSITCDSNDGVWLINLGNGSIKQLVKEGSTWKIDTAKPVRVPLEFFYR